MGLLALLAFTTALISGRDTAGVASDTAELFRTRREALIEQAATSEKSSLAEQLASGKIAGISFRSRFTCRLQQAAGYADRSYKGSPVSSYQRVKFSGEDHWSGCVLAEKDPGEPSWTDCTTANICWRTDGLLSRVVIGDYLIEHAEGVGLWRGCGYSKGGDIAAPVDRVPDGIIPNTSSGEEMYLRGAAAALRVGSVSPVFFYSHRPRSATISGDGIITSLYTEGYFRTENEIRKKNAASETVMGGTFTARWPADNRIGAAVISSSFSHPLRYDDRRQVRRDFTLVSVSDRAAFAGMDVFTEVAAMNSGIGFIAGTRITAGRDIAVTGVFRRYEPGFYAIHGAGFGESGSNEQGMYAGITFRPAAHVRASLWMDHFGAIRPSGISLPTHATDFFAEVSFIPSRRMSVTLRGRWDNTAESAGSNASNGTIRRRVFRSTVDYRTSDALKTRWWFEYDESGNYPGGPVHRGVAFYFDVLSVPSEVMEADFRISVFSTGGSGTMIREYERDCEGLFPVVLLYGRGMRWYVLLKYRPVRSAVFTLKYSDHTRNDVSRIGTGADQLPGNHDNRIAVQVDWGE